MKVKNKYLALGMLFGFISCDLSMKNEIKEQSFGLLGDKNFILDTNEESIKKILMKGKSGVDKNQYKYKDGKGGNEETFTYPVKRESTNNSNLLQKTAMSEENNLNSKLLVEQFKEPRREKIQKQRDDHEGITLGGSLNFSSLKGESGEFKETIESNEIEFIIDSNLGLNSGSISISSMYEIEEEDYYDWSDYYDYDDYCEEMKLSNRYESYLKSVKYNVNLAIKTINEIYNDYTLFSTKQAQRYSTRLDSATKAKAEEEAKRFTKEKLKHDLKNLLYYIQVSVKTPQNFIYISEIDAKNRLAKVENEIKNLISEVEKQSYPYEAYKKTPTTVLLVRDSLKEVQTAIDKNGVWY
ncbi:ferrous iron transporter A [Borreliella valaisiana]|uniref:ferrous iron transporter A n=1 Tax=Borreliella valaisiana TaxID=62088 RepID=UPI001AEF660D|nr:ferrous iron transporter A [Borreliella valaisiana]